MRVVIEFESIEEMDEWAVNRAAQIAGAKVSQNQEPSGDVEWFNELTLHLTVREENLLVSEGIVTPTRLKETTEWDLKRIPGLGRKSLKGIITAAKAMGITIQKGNV